MTSNQWINKNETNSAVLTHPDIKGWVAIRNDQSQTVASNQEAEKLGEVLIFFKEVATQLGETFAMSKPVDEIHIVCDELTSVCLPGNKETVGVIFDKGTNPNQFLARYKTAE